MKNVLLFCVLFITINVFSQTTYVPDDNFEQALIDLGYDSGVLNDYVPTVNINTVTSLDVRFENILDLTGIEDFTALTELDCSLNDLTSLDLTSNTNLTDLNCSSNELTSLNINSNTLLTNLECNYNELTNLNISNNTLLTNFDANGNDLTSINVTNNVLLVNLYLKFNEVNSIDITNNTLLTHLNLGSNGTSSNNLNTLDLSNNTQLTYLDCGHNDLTSLDLSNNTQLTFLNCESNDLTTLNVSNNTLLTDLTCNANNLSSISLTNNTLLTDLEIDRFSSSPNSISTLNLSNNTLLEKLYCHGNNLTNLNLTNNTVLNTVEIENNSLSSINVTNCAQLKYFSVEQNNLSAINVTGNPLLLTLEVGQNNLTSIDVHNNILLTRIDCETNQLTVLNTTLNTALTTLDCSDNLLTNLNLNNNTLLTRLDFETNQLTSIDVSNNTQINNFNCSSNQIAILDLSNNLSLYYLYCASNLLINLDLSLNTSLAYLNCSDNQLNSLDLKNGNNVEFSLSFSFNSTLNANLTCIKVDDATYSTTNWTYIDAQSYFSETCSLTNVPDDNFEQELINLGYDIVLDDYVYTDDINTLTSLNIASKSISDLTGIEDFTSLTALDVQDNTLTILELNSNTVLETLNFENNNLSIIDIGDCPNLTDLLAENNQISEIDLSMLSNLETVNFANNTLTRLTINNGNNTNITSFNTLNNTNLYCIEVDNEPYSNANWTNIDTQTSFNTNCHYGETYVPDDNFEQELINLGYDSGVLDDYVLTSNITSITILNLSAKSILDLTGIEDFTDLENLLCAGNSLTNIDISNNTNLLLLNCSNNTISSIDTTNNLVLETINCASNQITSLDLSQNTLLNYLDCSDNSLTNLNLFNNINLESLNCSQNQIGGLNLITNTNLTNLNCSHNLLTGLILTNGNNTAITNANFDTTFNVSLTCIEVDDTIYSTTNWTNIDFHTNFANNCHYGETYVPDNNFEQELINLGYDSVLDDYVITSNINTIGLLNVSFKSINDLTGIGDFMALTQLICNNNNMTNLDLGNNFNLAYINCSFNLLSDLYISSPNLNFLSASNNQLLDIDLSGKLFLTHVELQNNLLNSLNIKNGNNTSITNFNSTSNSNLFCVQVDDIAYANTNWTSKDAHTMYNTNCNYPSIWRTSHWINGVPNLTKDAIIDDNYNTGAFGNFNAYSLNINIGNQVTISPNSYIRVNTNVINNGDFTIEHEGSFLQLQDFASVGGTGNFTVKSKTTSLIDADRFTYFSSPTANENLNTFTSWANTNSMWSFDTSIQDWSLESSSNNMLLAKGYAIKGQPDVGQYPFKGTTNFQGYFNNGIISVPMHFTAGDPLLDDDNTLIGNPYPSAVSASLLLNNNLNANAFYFWTHTSILGSSGYIADDYAIWNRSGGVASSSGSPAPTGYIASCQGFFVTSLATANFVFHNSVRVTGNNDDFRTPNTQENETKIWLNLTDDNGLFNQILLNFSEDGSYNYDATFEAKRFNSDYPIQFYSNGLNNEHFAIQALPVLLENEIIPLGCNVIDKSVTNLKISIDHLENFDNVAIYLKDNLLNSIHDLKTSDYNFEVSTSTSSTRFELILNRNTLNLNENEFTKEHLIISNLSENKIAVASKNGTIITSLKAYDVLGKLIIDAKPNLADFVIPVNLNKGTVLFLNGILKNGIVLKTKFIKL